MASIKNFISEFRIWFCNFVIAYVPFHFIRLAYYRNIMRFKIGKGSTINLGCQFNTPGQFEMMENSTVNQFCHLDNRGGITIGNNVSVSPKVSLVSADHDVNDPECPGRTGPIILEDYVFVGYNAIILKDCILKRGSVLGARSLLTKSTFPCGIYFGNPAKLAKYRDENFTYSGKYIRLFH
jgi:acetyltransferase-like isoleucine patch superfamily enzyme